MPVEPTTIAAALGLALIVSALIVCFGEKK